MQIIAVEEMYKDNDEFKEYVDRYCAQYGYTVNEALTHAYIKHYAQCLLSRI